MLEIKAVHTRAELITFIKFNIALYKNSPYAIPPLIADDLNTLSKSKNPAFEFCDSQYFLCYRDGEIVGRIAAIINHKANQTWNKRNGRFGFIDFIEDFEVAKALIQAAQQWVQERGMDTIEGPLGFTDMDPEGMLIEGFDQLGTMSTIYNYPYYPQYMERMGFTKAADWVEAKIFMPDRLPDRIARVSELVESRSGIKVLRFKNARQIIKQGRAHDLFSLVNTAFAPLYGYSALSQRQIGAYIKQYIPLVRLELLTMITDRDDKLIAFGLGLPSLSRVMQKSKGKLFPTGLIHLLGALRAKKVEVVDFMLIAIAPQWQGRGVNAVIMKEFIEQMRKLGTIYAESNPELELNTQIYDQWSDFTVEYHKRRRAFIREIKK